MTRVPTTGLLGDTRRYGTLAGDGAKKRGGKWGVISSVVGYKTMKMTKVKVEA